MCRLAQGKQRNGPDPLDYDRERYAKYVGRGLQTLGVYTANIPYVGAAIALLGVYAEDGLVYLGSPGLNLSISPIPEADPQSVGMLAQCLLREALFID